MENQFCVRSAVSAIFPIEVATTGSRTSNCRSLLNIGPNDLILLLKDKQLNLLDEF